MIKSLQKLQLLSLILLCPLICYSIPAKPGLIEIRQPDGSSIPVTIHGDEHFHYYRSADGYALRPDSDGWLCYLTDINGRTELSNVRTNPVGHRTPSENAIISGTNHQSIDSYLNSEHKRLTESFRKKKISVMRKYSPNTRAVQIDGLLTDYPTVGSPKALILLVEFKDRRFSTENAGSEFTRLMTEQGYDYNGATGSALDYFSDNSSGLFTPEFKVYGPITLPNNMSHYGAETANSHDAAPWEMVADGCSLLKEQNPDLNFSQFDNDGDGVIDNVFVFFAGYGQNSGADPSSIWPHAANITWYGVNLVIDGVKVDNYACTNELQGNSGSVRTGIGTFCHEFSHVLGLPDIYPTNYSNSFTPGAYEVMDSGPYNNNGNTPPYMSAFNRMCLRWLNPRELTAPETVELPDISQNKAFLINTAKKEEYYLFENRQQQGWDTYIPGHGMLVWHIDYNFSVWNSNSVNNIPGHQYIDVVEADGELTEESRAGDPFPGRTGVNEFTDESSPAMTSWTGVRIGKPITDIKEQDGVISFKVMGGGAGIASVTALDASEVTPTSFRANWDGDVTIDTYEIDVCAGREVIPFVTLTKTTKGSADCYIDVTGLDPLTDYHYVVRATDGEKKSADSNTIHVTTLAPTFDMLQTIALEASDISDNSFTASWLPVEGAEYYELSVYQKRYVTPVYDTVDFTGGISAMPDGWATTATATSGVAGTFGAARPSLTMKTDYDRIASPSYDFDINELSFWYRGNSSIEGLLSVEIFTQGTWRELETIDVTGITKGTTAKYTSDTQTSMPAGTRAIRLTFMRKAGNLYIDDISVAYNGAAEHIFADGFERAYVGNVTSKSVDGLSASGNYYYVVTARCGDLAAITSDEITVDMTTSTEDTLSDLSKLCIQSAPGGIMLKGASDLPVRISDIAGRIVFSTDNYIDGAFIKLPAGFYLVTAGNKTLKTVLRR